MKTPRHFIVSLLLLATSLLLATITARSQPVSSAPTITVYKSPT